MKPKSHGINTEWHKQNVIPKNPTVEQRIEWHVEHSKNCGCRPIPETIAAEIKKRRLS